MKHSLNILIGSLAIAALTACGGGGGGSSDSGTPGAVGIAGVNGTQGYLGKGDWSGSLIGQNVATQQYQMFMYQYGGNQGFTTLFNMRIWSGRTGILPEQMGFSINNGRNMGGDGFINGNGFLINNYSYGGYGYGGGMPYGGGGYYPGQVQCFAYPCQPQVAQPVTAAGTPVIQISTQFVDVCRNTMNVQVRYQNVIVLSGTMTGMVQYTSPYGGAYPGQYPGQYPGYAGYPGQTMIPGQANIPAQCYMNQQYAQPQQQQYYTY